ALADVDRPAERIRLAGIDSLQQADIEISEARKKVITSPAAQLVRLIASEVSDRIGLVESQILRINALDAALGHRSAAGSLSSVVAAKFRIRVVAADVQVPPEAILSLHFNRAVVAFEIVRVAHQREVSLRATG